MKRILLISVILAAMLLSACAAPSHQGMVRYNDQWLTREEYARIANAKSPVPTPGWTKVTSWKGNSIKDTETFSITANEWRIQWSTEPGQYDMNFQIYVFKANGNWKSVAANVIGKGSDVSYVRGAGSYYLTINTGQSYTITIEQKQ